MATLGPSTGGTNTAVLTASTTGGTGLVGGTSVPLISINANFGSAKIIDTSLSEIGAEGATVTGGTPGPTLFYPTGTTSEFLSSIIMTKGTTLALSITPPPSNTSMLVLVSINVHKTVVV